MSGSRRKFFLEREDAFFPSNVEGQDKTWPQLKIFVAPISRQTPKMWYAFSYQVTRLSAFTCISKVRFSINLNGLSRRVEAENNKKKQKAKYYGEMIHV